MDAARRERRHHRKAAAAGAVGVGGVGGGGGGAAAARAAYGDVFGGPPRFAAPFGAAPLDYAEVFGGVAATCSIPYLDLPPAPSLAAAGGFFACRGKGDYGEIFGRFDFADFALPYEDLFGEPQPEPVPDAAGETDPEIASSSGSSTRSALCCTPSLPPSDPLGQSSPASLPLCVCVCVSGWVNSAGGPYCFPGLRVLRLQTLIRKTAMSGVHDLLPPFGNATVSRPSLLVG